MIELNAGSLSSSQIAELLINRSAKSVRHQAEKLEISLTGWIKYSATNIKLAIELRCAGFTRPEINEATGLTEFAQRYYESKHYGKSNI